MKTLEDQLNAGIKRYKNWGEKNQQAAFAVFALAVLAILAATILSTRDDVKPWIRALVAASPGMMLLINSTFRFEAKSRWHWEKTRGYEELLRALTIEQMPPQEVSRKLSKLDQRMDEKWISFGHLPTVSTRSH
jgi:hypothetical protein